MRVSSLSPSSPTLPSHHPSAFSESAPPSSAAEAPKGLPLFQPLSVQAFFEARTRHVPVFLLIGEVSDSFADPSLAAQLTERTVPVHLIPGARPDIELLCQRAGALFSEEGALPLCALLLDDGRPFLAAPLPPVGFPLDPSRLYVWLSQADRRFVQSLPALLRQASQVISSFRSARPPKPYSPSEAAHDLLHALLTIEDRQNGGFGHLKTPLVSALRFLQHASMRGDQHAHRALSGALDAMLSSALYDPLDGAFFRSTLTEDWRVFVPEKPLALNALLALILLEDGRRSEAVRLLDFLLNTFSFEGGGFSAFLTASRAFFSFTPEQVCSVLGNEDGLRACRLLSLLHQHTRPEPDLAPSRFSPVPADAPGRRLSMDIPALCPTLPAHCSPEDSAFLRRVLPLLFRSRSARAPQHPARYILTQDCAIAAAVFAHCGRRLGEVRYTQAAQRAATFLISLPPAPGLPSVGGLPASIAPVDPLHAQASCGASAALSLALLILGQEEDREMYAQSGLRLLNASLHAFIGREGMPMQTPPAPAAFFPQIPAVYDNELPSPAALLVHALRLANNLNPSPHYGQLLDAFWESAAPAAYEQPLSCAALIDALTV